MAFDTVIDKAQLEKEMTATADAIRTKIGDASPIEWSADTGFANAIQSIQTGSIEENRRIYRGTIIEAVVGSGKYVVLVKDGILAEHRNDDTLFVRVEFDFEPTAYSIKKTWGANRVDTIPVSSTVVHQQTLRWDANVSNSYASNNFALNDVTTPESNVGRVLITEEGELRVYSNSSSNYAIRPSNYTVTVEW